MKSHSASLTPPPPQLPLCRHGGEPLLEVRGRGPGSDAAARRPGGHTAALAGPPGLREGPAPDRVHLKEEQQRLWTRSESTGTSSCATVVRRKTVTSAKAVWIGQSPSATTRGQQSAKTGSQTWFKYFIFFPPPPSRKKCCKGQKEAASGSIPQIMTSSSELPIG